MSTKYPEMVSIDPDNLKRDLSGPAMRGLLDQGYSIGPAFLWQEKPDEAPSLYLLMCPPVQVIQESPPLAIQSLPLLARWQRPIELAAFLVGGAAAAAMFAYVFP